MATTATNPKQEAHELIDRISTERAVAASKAWLKDHDPIPNEEVLAEFGLTAEDFERMGRTPLDPEPHHPGQ